MLKPGSLRSGSRKLVADNDSVASHSSARKLAADTDNETIFPCVEESVSREKEDRDLNVVQTLKGRQNLHKFLERKAEFSRSRRKIRSEKRLSEAEADMEAREWEKRNSDIALYAKKQELESQRLQLQLQANQCADQTQRERR